MNDLAALQRENAELRALVEKLTSQLATLNDRVAELLAVAQRRQRNARTKPVPAKPAAPELAGDVKETFDARPNPPTKPAEPAKSKKPRRPTGRKPLPPHLEAEEHSLRPDVCVECGSGDLDVADEVVEEKLQEPSRCAVPLHRRP